jgi:HPt (histidine-containing phosphotransfer) domain-containing protein
MFLHDSSGHGAARASFERPIDLVHLARQTLGDRALEAEILDLFMVQARALVDRLSETKDGRMRLEIAHTLKGSARAVGAFRVARAAEDCERVASADDAGWRAALSGLASAVREANGAIADLRHAA